MFFTILVTMAAPHLKFSTRVSPSIISTQQSFWSNKNFALGVLRYGLGWKQPRLVILATYISRLGTKLCPNELIFHSQIEEKNSSTLFYKKKINLIKYKGRKLSFKIFAPTMSSILRPRIFILDFFQFYLIKFIKKKKMCFYRFLLNVHEIWAHIYIYKCPNLSFRIVAPAVSLI